MPINQVVFMFTLFLGPGVSSGARSHVPTAANQRGIPAGMRTLISLSLNLHTPIPPSSCYKKNQADSFRINSSLSQKIRFFSLTVSLSPS
jgi:hypothetical protein